MYSWILKTFVFHLMRKLWSVCSGPAEFSLSTVVFWCTSSGRLFWKLVPRRSFWPASKRMIFGLTLLYHPDSFNDVMTNITLSCSYRTLV